MIYCLTHEERVSVGVSLFQDSQPDSLTVRSRAHTCLSLKATLLCSWLGLLISVPSIWCLHGIAQSADRQLAALCIPSQAVGWCPQKHSAILKPVAREGRTQAWPTGPLEGLGDPLSGFCKKGQREKTVCGWAVRTVSALSQGSLEHQLSDWQSCISNAH